MQDDAIKLEEQSTSLRTPSTDHESRIANPVSHLPYGRQWIDDEDIAAVVEVLKSDFLTTGPKVEAFEQSLTSYTGAGFASAVNSGTSSLHVAYFGAGLKEGLEIITSPITFAATANAALYLGARVRFVDVDPETALIDPIAIGNASTDEPMDGGLIVPIDFGGQPADYDTINDIASNKGLKVVSDAAHSLGATYKGRKVGTLCEATSLSFHPVKPVTTAEGGAVLTSDSLIASRAARFRTHGITRDVLEMKANEGPWWYEQHDLGFNYRMTDIQCALGIAQMRRIDLFLARRREIAARYDAALSGCGLGLPKRIPNVESGWHLYVVRVAEASRREAFFNRLRELGLGVQVHYIPVYWHPYYQELGFRRGLCPNAEDFYSRCVSLPIFPRMSDDDVDSSIERVLQAVEDVL
jgi:perosamine synthetase